MSRLPPASQPPAPADLERARDALRERGVPLEPPAAVEAFARLSSHAPALVPLALGDPSLLADTVATPLDRAIAPAEWRRALAGAPSLGDGKALRRLLRRTRHRGITRIALREALRVADVTETAREMSELAAACIDAALAACRAESAEQEGRVVDEAGREVPLTVLGMGKLGGLELNLGSDVDLCFFYGTDDAEVRGPGRDRSPHEVFDRIVRRTVQALAEVTEDGFCFRVDLRLRPEGSRGPLVNSLASTERYYESWGRTWERAALSRARAIAGDLDFGAHLLETLRPFIFRRAVRPELAEEMGSLLKRSREELGVDLARDVKLGPGGIREAEFFVQTLQLVWGGRYPSLQVPGTLEALTRLRAEGLVNDREAETLAEAWTLLRRVEHRIHVWRGHQTHELPEGPELDAFAASLGFDGAGDLESALAETRRGVAGLFASLGPEGEPAEDHPFDALISLVAKGAPVEVVANRVAELLAVNDSYEAASHLGRLARRAASPLGPVTWERTPALARTLLGEVAGAADPDAALSHLADFFARLSGPWPYERWLVSEPRLARRLIGLFGASGTLSSALVGHPEDVDLLLSRAAPEEEEILGLHRALTDTLDEPEAPDLEHLVGELRQRKRAITLRLGLAYAAGELDLERCCERLSALAEGQIEVCLRAAEREAFERFGPPGDVEGDLPAALVVIAMGKLGGRELGFGGDLDLVFLYGANGESRGGRREPTTHAELFTRVAQRTMSLLRQRDAEGPGYETDTRLRPSGSKGTLVVSLEAFDAYHERSAAAWERQALVRARPVAGHPTLAAAARGRFEALAFERGPTPAEELAHARGRIQLELAGERAGRYHPKLGYGGLVDVEFLVQWLQMKHGEERALRTASTRRGIAALREAGHLAADEAGVLEAARRFFRRVEQSLKLMDEHREPMLSPGGRSGHHVARSLGLRSRDGMSPTEALDERYRAHANEARRLLEEKVAKIGVPAPWEAS